MITPRLEASCLVTKANYVHQKHLELHHQELQCNLSQLALLNVCMTLVANLRAAVFSYVTA